MTSILGMIELLQGGDLDAKEQQEFLRRMQRETERIHRIVRQLLDFSRDTSQQAGPQSALNLAEVVEETVRLIAPQKDMSRVQIERRFPEDLPLVAGNRDGLIQVCLNLLLNAADAMHDEGAVVIETSETGETVSVSFRDSGPGIASTDLEKIFEPFFTTKEAGSGTGLGLAVCQSLVEGMGGRIVAENAQGGGARFRVTLQKSSGARLT